MIASSTCCISPGEVGLTAIHSLNYGTPVISHDNFDRQMPEVESIINNYNGFLFKHNDINSLATLLEAWIDKNQDRDEIRKRCYKIIDEKFNPKYQLNIIEELVSDMIKK